LGEDQTATKMVRDKNWILKTQVRKLFINEHLKTILKYSSSKFRKFKVFKI